MSGFTSPNYTQTPNDLFDLMMQDMGEAELKVTLAVIRMTFGYHTETVTASWRLIMKMTGLSSHGVDNGIKAAVERGTIEKIGNDSNGSTVWKINTDRSPQGSTKSVATTPRGAEVLPPGEQLNKKEKDISKETGFSSGTTNTDEENLIEGFTPEEYFDHLEDQKHSSVEEENKQGKNRTVEELKAEGLKSLDVGYAKHKGVTAELDRVFHKNYPWKTKTGKDFLEWVNRQPPEETVERFARWWWEYDWRGKDGQSPTLSQIQENWPQAFVKKESDVYVDQYGGIHL